MVRHVDVQGSNSRALRGDGVSCAECTTMIMRLKMAWYFTGPDVGPEVEGGLCVGRAAEAVQSSVSVIHPLMATNREGSWRIGLRTQERKC